MAISINTQSPKYQQYMTGVADLRADILPRLRLFGELSVEKQRWWLKRDPLMRRLVRLGWLINKHVPRDEFVSEISDDD